MSYKTGMDKKNMQCRRVSVLKTFYLLMYYPTFWHQSNEPHRTPINDRLYKM